MPDLTSAEDSDGLGVPDWSSSGFLYVQVYEFVETLGPWPEIAVGLPGNGCVVDGVVYVTSGVK